MVFAKTLIFGIVKNYFQTTLTEKICLGLETNLCFSSKALCDWIEQELLPTLFHEWML
jgi:hypothetical protein